MNRRQRVLDVFFPPRCPACGQIVRSGEVFCGSCLEVLTAGKTKRFAHGQQTAFSMAVSTMDYCPQTYDAILALKRIPDSAQAHFFAALLAQTLRAELPGVTFDYVTAVPMEEAKRRSRGHNQAQTLARLLAEELSSIYADDLLLQKKNGRVQHTLSKGERFANAAESYAAAKGAAVSGCVLLVDDVMTTGATMERCAVLLRQLGAENVIAAAAVSTPPHKMEPDENSEGSGKYGLQ